MPAAVALSRRPSVNLILLVLLGGNGRIALILWILSAASVPDVPLTQINGKFVMIQVKAAGLLWLLINKTLAKNI
jgi:hypothetical protein